MNNFLMKGSQSGCPSSPLKPVPGVIPEKKHLTAKNTGIFVLQKLPDNQLHRLWLIEIVAVNNTNQFAPGHRNSFIHGIVKTPVRLANPPGNVVFVSLDYSQGSIRGTSVNNDVFNVLIGLADNALYRLFQMFLTVKTDSYNADQRHNLNGIGGIHYF